VAPAPVVTPQLPGSIFIPSPTVPSVAGPPVLGPRDPGLPPAATYTIQYTGAASEEFSDNFSLSSTERIQNFRSILSPGVIVDINSAFTKGHIQYSLNLTHDSSSDEQTVNLFHTFVGRMNWEATPLLRFSVGDAFSRTDEPTQADRLSLRRERRTFSQNTFLASCDYLIDRVSTSANYRLSTFLGEDRDRTTAHTIGLSAGTSLYGTNTVSLGYEYLKSTTERRTVSTTDTLAAGATDITGHRLTASFSRQLSSLLSAGITGGYSIRNTDQGGSTGAGVGGTSDNFTVWNVSVFNSYTTPVLSLSGSLGYSQSTSDSGRGDSAVTSTTALSYRFARAVATLSIDSGFSETFAEGDNVGLVQTRGIVASLLYPITSAVTGTVSGYYRDNTGVGSSGGTATTVGANLSLNVRLTNWLGLLLDYAYIETSSSKGSGVGGLGGNDYTENRARVSLNAAL